MTKFLIFVLDYFLFFKSLESNEFSIINNIDLELLIKKLELLCNNLLKKEILNSNDKG